MEQAPLTVAAPASEPVLLTERQVCRLLGVSRVSLFKWRRRGVFPRPIRFGPGRMIRWRREDVATWLASRPVA